MSPLRRGYTFRFYSLTKFCGRIDKHNSRIVNGFIKFITCLFNLHELYILVITYFYNVLVLQDMTAG